GRSSLKPREFIPFKGFSRHLATIDFRDITQRHRMSLFTFPGFLPSWVPVRELSECLRVGKLCHLSCSRRGVAGATKKKFYYPLVITIGPRYIDTGMRS